MEQGIMGRYLAHIMCTQGKGSFVIASRTYTFEPGDIVIVLPELKITDFMLSPDFKAQYLLISHTIASNNNPNAKWGNKGFVVTFDNPIFKFSEQQQEMFVRWCNLFERRLKETEHIFYNEMLGSLVQTFLYDMWNTFSKELNERTLSTEKGPIFERFIELVRSQCKEHREVAYYANKLCVTPKYLSEVCKKKSGRSAMEWVQEFMAQEIMHYLKDTNLRLSEIASILNFSTQPFFCRYVRNVLGVSPTDYRKDNIEK